MAATPLERWPRPRGHRPKGRAGFEPRQDSPHGPQPGPFGRSAWRYRRRVPESNRESVAGTDVAGQWGHHSPDTARTTATKGSWSSVDTTITNNARHDRLGHGCVSHRGGVLRGSPGNTAPDHAGCRPFRARQRRTNLDDRPDGLCLPRWVSPRGVATQPRRRRELNPDHDRDRAVCSPDYTTSARVRRSPRPESNRRPPDSKSGVPRQRRLRGCPSLSLSLYGCGAGVPGALSAHGTARSSRWPERTAVKPPRASSTVPAHCW